MYPCLLTIYSIDVSDLFLHTLDKSHVTLFTASDLKSMFQLMLWDGLESKGLDISYVPLL